MTHPPDAGEPTSESRDAVVLRGEGLNLADLEAVSRHGRPTRLSRDETVRRRIEGSLARVLESARTADPVYGITTGFGGMANITIEPGDAAALQENLLRFTTVGAGRPIPKEEVRAAMVLRANSHMRGVSGLRPEIIERLAIFLNEGATPQVREFGSIGASGDLCPLAQIMGALCGLDAHYRVDLRGEDVDCLTALRALGLEPLRLGPKEGLAMINGTSVMTGIAALATVDARRLLALAFGLHALYLQALRGTNQSFHPFVHQHKPHPGQVSAAAAMLRLLEGTRLGRDELDGHHEQRGAEPIQDRYSLRCLPQYMGPIVDALRTIAAQIEVEMNCANDNPLIDPDSGASYHAGNFLGQYVGVAMDQLRHHVGLIAKHLDVQIALLMAPEFSNGLSASLVGNTERRINMGLKGLQICGNSIMPLLGFLGAPLVDRYPTHAEQFNQNINSMGFGSANLARQSIETARHYFAVACLVGIQAADLRTRAMLGHFDAREALSPATRPLYEAVRQVLGRAPAPRRPYVWNDDEQVLEADLALVADDLAAAGSLILSTLSPIEDDLR